jgi:hypothetical protein
MHFNEDMYRSTFDNSYVREDANLTALFKRRYLDFADADPVLS